VEVTARHIAEWAGGKSAQAALPRYVRRLIHDAGNITQIAVPAGDSTSQPGWDGEITSEHGNAWVPKGKSFWEMSCEAQPASKANYDYNKRTDESPEDIRKASTLVVVTARKWIQKRKWLADKQAAADWKEVRVYDADDLEQWLEQTPAVKLRFGDEIGLTGHGVEDVERHWTHWAKQTDVAITPEAFFAGRESARDRFIAELRKRLEEQTKQPVTIRADSAEEASAFAVACLQSEPGICSKALVVTDPTGWRFVEQNPSLRVAVAARPEIAERPTQQAGLIVIIPYATGDMTSRENAADIVLERPNIYEFEKALVSVGLDNGDAKRLASSTGRSWSVLRRRRALNPSVRRPAWLDGRQVASLSTLCLLGAWSANRPADRAIVAELSKRNYEDIEQDLRHLALLDDAPIMEIGEVWRAKSPLELLDLFGDRITRDEIDRFFHIARRVLTSPDPMLELPDSERYAAQIYGKVRSESGLLIRSICDTLVKLSVRGPQIPSLAATNIEMRVSAFVRDLLQHADGLRWLSLAAFLPDLAEATPEVFLKCIEISLAATDAPVTRLLTETSSSGSMGRCWHAGLLWALERLAWAPQRLTRISLLLARLSHTEIKGNWANSPKHTLVDLFRIWIPQTAARLERRISAIDELIKHEADVAFGLLDQLVTTGPDTASPSARPNWRDEDASAGRGVTNKEHDDMLFACADRLIACAKGHPRRVAKLLDKISIFDPHRLKATLALAEEFTNSETEDDDKETVRDALRKKIHWQRNYGSLRGAALESHLGRLERLYEKLAPKNIVVCHRWLFSESWPYLPTRTGDESHIRQSELIEAARLAAIEDIYKANGLDGIEALIKSCPNLGHIGVSLAKLDLPEALLHRWIVMKGEDFSENLPVLVPIRGILRVSTPDRARRIANAVLEEARQTQWRAEKIARFLMLTNNNRETWNIAANLGAEVENAYWKACVPSFWLREDEADFKYALRRLVAVRRPRTALQFCHLDLEKIDPLLLADTLEGLLRNEEPDGPLPASHLIGEALDRLEKSGSLERTRLVNIEFGLILALGHDGERRAASLYAALMFDPKLFTELICLAHAPANREQEELETKTKNAAQIAWHVLRACRRQPGIQADGRIDQEEFVRFIDEARSLCKDADRLSPCDSRLGQILAHAPPDGNGVWPIGPVRDMLNRPDVEEMRSGFAMGARNRRGVTSRRHDEGGVQERNLAATYRAHAHALQDSHFNVAAVLEQLALGYESDGLREDLQAKLRREGY
jgi:hypothetical protein